MTNKPNRKRAKEEEDWIYDPVVAREILRARKEVDNVLKKGGDFPTLEDLIEKFQKEDAKKIRD